MNRIDSLSGIKYLKTKYTNVIPVYTKIDVAGSTACVDVDLIFDAVCGVVVVVVCAVVVGVVVCGVVEDIYQKIIYILYFYIINLLILCTKSIYKYNYKKL